MVYVSLGALCWLPSVDEWAAQVAGLLAARRAPVPPRGPSAQPGPGRRRPPAWSAPYFEEAEPYEDTEPGTYADPTATEALPGDPTYGWNHGIGEIVGALLGRGLRLDHLEEHDWTSFPRFPWLVETGEEEFVATRRPPPGAAVVHPGGQPGSERTGGPAGRRAQPRGPGRPGCGSVQPAPDTLRGS